MVYVEMDRCAADAVAHVTGVKSGRRSLKFVDYGIMAATFVHLKTGDAVRVISTEEARDLAPVYAPHAAGKSQQQLEAYKRMPDSVLFRVQQVEVKVSEFDLPGPTRRKISCRRCGQVVRDHREVLVDGQVLCRPCAGGAYFKDARENSRDRPFAQDTQSVMRISAISSGLAKITFTLLILLKTRSMRTKRPLSWPGRWPERVLSGKITRAKVRSTWLQEEMACFQ